jgi:hypothetical protein
MILLLSLLNTEITGMHHHAYHMTPTLDHGIYCSLCLDLCCFIYFSCCSLFSCACARLREALQPKGMPYHPEFCIWSPCFVFFVAHITPWFTYLLIVCLPQKRELPCHEMLDPEWLEQVGPQKISVDWINEADYPKGKRRHCYEHLQKMYLL